MIIYRCFIISILLLFSIKTTIAATAGNENYWGSFVADKELYGRFQVDSIVRAEIVKNFDTLVTMKTNERLINYISEQNNHHEQENNRLAWIAILVTIVALAGPFVINRHYEKWIEKNLEENQKYINWYISNIEKQIENKVTEVLNHATNTVKSYTSESKKGIDDKINERLIQVEGVIKNYENSLNSLKSQVEKFAEQAKKSENTVNKTAQEIELVKSMNEYNKENDENRQIRLLLKMIKLDPTNTDNLKKLAEKYASIFDYDNAIDYISKYIDVKPYVPDGYSIRAKYYLLKNNISNAIEDYSQAIITGIRYGKGKDIDALYYERGMAYEANDQLKESLEDYNMAKKIALENDSGVNTYIEAIGRVEEKIERRKEGKGTVPNISHDKPEV